MDPISGAAGSAYVTENVVVSWRNNNHASTLQTELAAIDGALAHAEGGQGSTIIVHTDSKGALQTLQRRHQTDNIRLATSILGRAREMTARGACIRLNWIPSHVGLAGNERADTAARQATHLPMATVHLRPSLRQTKEKARNRAWSITHNTHQRMAITSPSMRWYQTATGLQPLIPSRRRTRAVAVATQRLRLGYRTLAEIQPGRGTLTCQYCNTRAEEPLIHYLLSCPSTAQLRTQLTEDNPEGRTVRAAALVRRACEDPTALEDLLRRTPPPR